MTDNTVFVIPTKRETFRVLFDDGLLMDVQCSYGMNSDERGLVLEEAERRWGKRTKETRYTIAGVAKLP